MDLGESLAVYVDDRVEEERWISKQTLLSSETESDELRTLPPTEGACELGDNVRLLVKAFEKVYLCKSGISFASKLAELSETSETNFTPVFGFIDVGYTSDSESIYRRSGVQPLLQSSLSSPPENPSRRGLTFSAESEELSGLHLLHSFAADIQVHEARNVIVPIAILRSPQPPHSTESNEDRVPVDDNRLEATTPPTATTTPLERRRIHRCLDAGAVDVLTSPLEESTLQRLSVDAYRTKRAAQREQSGFLANRKLRKKSWVGATDQKPYAYLREAMVSKLMKRICNPELAIEDSPICAVPIPDERKREIEAEVAKWQFCAHDFTDDELVYAATSMIAHALQLPELEPWRISTEELEAFILSARSAYNSFVLYHNFRHAVDVLQSTFHFLTSIHVLPDYPGNCTISEPRSDIAVILTPFDALTLLVTAIGHDVGHPGVNNGFLVRLNAPLAQLYNDKSVLEAFHCAAFSQILRRHWPAVFEDKQLRALMISSILATDMGVHSQFMEEMAKMRLDYCARRGGGKGYQPEHPESARALLCALLIKCADIGNVARHWYVAEQWANVLQQEFAHQGDMEREIGMETALFGGPPDLDDPVKKANGQIGFMDFFALPLFDGVTELLPDMAFAAVEIRRNRSIWKRLIEREKTKELPIEMRPPEQSEEDIVRDEETHQFKMAHVPGPVPTSWKPPPDLLQYDGSSEKDDGTILAGREDLKEAELSPLSAEPQPPTNVPVDNNSRKETKNGSGPAAGSPSSSPRVGQEQLQLHRSSGQSSLTTTATSRPNESSSGARTQSTSTYTNNTVMTPISSTTGASSVISASSSCNGDHCPGAETDSPIATKERCRTAVSLGQASRLHRPSREYRHQNGQRIHRSTSFVNDLLDRSFGSGSTTRITLKDPSATPRSDPLIPKTASPTSSPPLPPALDSQSSSSTSLATGCSPLQRRRSRLRLAFWRRTKSSPSSPPPPRFTYR